MHDLLRLALLVGGYEEFASQIGQLHRAAVSNHEVRGFQLAAVHQGKSDPLNPRAKLFHEIERERFSAARFRSVIGASGSGSRPKTAVSPSAKNSETPPAALKLIHDSPGGTTNSVGK